MSLQELFKVWTGYLASGVEALAGFIIAIAAIQATIRVFVLLLQRKKQEAPLQEPMTEIIRLRLGRWLALALEFELGADILRTAIAPTWMEIGQLAAIATIRTLLNYFLQKEIDRAARRQPDLALQSHTPSTDPLEPGRNSFTRIVDRALH